MDLLEEGEWGGELTSIKALLRENLEGGTSPGKVNSGNRPKRQKKDNITLF